MACKSVLLIHDEINHFLIRSLKASFGCQIVEVGRTAEAATSILLDSTSCLDLFRSCSAILIIIKASTLFRLVSDNNSSAPRPEIIIDYVEKLIVRIRSVNSKCPIMTTTVRPQMVNNYVLSLVPQVNDQLEFCKTINDALFSRLRCFPNVAMSRSCLTIPIRDSKVYKTYLRIRSTASVESCKILVAEFKDFFSRTTISLPKLIFVDLDNTLWGGIISESFENIRLGGHDPIGEAYIHIQTYLKRLASKGILLAIVSKNDPRLVEEFFNAHGEMPLSLDNFVAHRAGWEPKSSYIADILKSLNLRSADCAFLDDSLHERSEVSQAFPDLRILSMPSSIYERLLYLEEALPVVCNMSTNVDSARLKLYKQKIKRDQSLIDFDANSNNSENAYDRWLKSLQIMLYISTSSTPPISARLIQLYSRTNQFNLTGRHLGETDITALTMSGSLVVSGRCVDSFGDEGIVISAIIVSSNDTLILSEFVMSCRVIGRFIEDAFLYHILTLNKGITKVCFNFSNSGKNASCKSFLQRLSPASRLLSNVEVPSPLILPVESLKDLRFSHVHVKKQSDSPKD